MHDTVSIGTGVRGETKSSTWRIQLLKRTKKKNVIKDRLTLCVQDVITVAHTGDEPWVILDIKGWPEKHEPK